MGTYIGIASSNGQTFANARQDDFILYAQRPSRLLMGTQSNVKSKIQINSNAITMSDTTIMEGRVQVNNTLAVTGLTALYGDLYVAGNLITSQDLVMEGYQIAAGASYCNGDLLVVNDTVGAASSNANVYVESVSGNPIIHLRQTDASASNTPFQIYQLVSGDAYITNTKNIYVGNSNNLNFVAFSSNNAIGVNTSVPKAMLDVKGGDINARNHIRKSMSGSTSNPVGLTVNWEASAAGSECIILETVQLLGLSGSDSTYHGTRNQRHKLVLGSPYTVVPQVACGVGDMESYTALYIGMCNVSSNAVHIYSRVQSSLGRVTTQHQLDMEVLLAPSSLGHVWLS